MYAQSQSLMGLGELAQLFGYTRDHLAYLCRTGQIEAARNGRSWQTTLEEVERYKNNLTEAQKQRWEEMSRRQKSDVGSQMSEAEVIRLRRTQSGFRVPASEFRSPGLLTLSLNHSLAHAVQSPSVLADLLSGGALSAFDSFHRAGQLLIGWPLRGLFWTVNRGAYVVYLVFNMPLASLRPYWKLATVPVHELYPQFNEQYSLYGLVKASRGAHLTLTSALSVFIAFSFLFAGANFIGGAAGTVSGPPALIAQSALVRDYLQVQTPSVPQVAGAATASYTRGATLESFKTFLMFWSQTLDCTRFFCYNTNIELNLY